MKKTNVPTSPDKKTKTKKNILRVGALTLAATLMLIIMPKSGEMVSASKLTDSKVKKFEDQIAALNAEMEALQAQVANTKDDIESITADKERLDTEMNILISKIEITNALIAELETSIGQKNAEISDKEAAYAEKYEHFKERIRLSREEGRIGYLEMLLSASNLSDFLLNADRVGSLLSYDHKIMESLKSEKRDLESARTQYQTQKTDQENYMSQLRVDEASLEAKIKEAELYLTKLEGNKAQYQALYEKNLAAEAALQKQLEAYLKELAAKQNNKYVGGVFMWPVPQTYVRVSSEFGGRTSPITGKYEYHNGIDIPAAYGTSIYASNGGTVTIATKHYSYGNYIMIDHGGGYATLYAHASQLLVKKGDKVNKGDVIAKVGSTGYSTGNHLHFSMYENSALADPRKWFPK